MSRIVLLMEQKENRRLLAEWLSLHHEVLCPVCPPGPDVPFDLGLVDAPSLERYGPWIAQAKRSVNPVFLPFLLVTHRRGYGLETGNAWELVDDVIISPSEKVEL